MGVGNKMGNGNGASVSSREADAKKKEGDRRTPAGPLTLPPEAREAAGRVGRRRRRELGRAKPEPDKAADAPLLVGVQLNALLTGLGRRLRSVDEQRASIRAFFDRLSYEDQELVFKHVYNVFSEKYDLHMEDTGHYPAIKRLITKEISVHHFRFPILDMSAGTGVPIKYLLLELNRQLITEGRSIEFITPEEQPSNICPVYVNDLSEKMLDRSKQRMTTEFDRELHKETEELSLIVPPILDSNERLRISYMNHSFRSLQQRHSRLKEKIGTILVSQTFHIVSPQDKEQLASTIDWALAPGGRVIILEEFAWRARTHSSHQFLPVLKFIESIATPLPRKADIISKFKDSEGRPYDMVARSTERIDTLYRDHEMTITILQKPPVSKPGGGGMAGLDSFGL
ncbi:class I SAM-dependent methyltransferase [Candidatus Micrarchaeota archaeon]|nr:class I SAM-dependent methyltransferase [Candidatus Micrarchaeota archaeon]